MPAATTTSTPWRVSSLMVASFTSGASTVWPQPDSSATRLRRGPCAAKTCGRSTGDGAGIGRGTLSSIARIDCISPAPRLGSSLPKGRASAPSISAQRKAPGRGIRKASAARGRRSPSGRA